MKLDLNPLQLLALHNLLHERCAGAGMPVHELYEEAVPDDVSLVRVYDQLRTCIFEALDAKEAPAVDPRFDAWAAAQRAKIDALRDDRAAADDVEQQVAEQQASRSVADAASSVAGERSGKRPRRKR